MSEIAVVVDDTIADRVPSLLREHGFQVDLYRRQFRSQPTYRCTKLGTAILVHLNRPAHWKASGDMRQELTIVATLGAGTILKFWLRRKENVLRREVIEILKGAAQPSGA